MTPDTINAVFEGGGAVLLCLNVRRLYRDKTLAGVSLVPTVWWNIWGFWNVYYYSALGQPLSFWAGLGVVALNTVWVALALYYRWRAQPAASPALFHYDGPADALGAELQRALQDLCADGRIT